MLAAVMPRPTRLLRLAALFAALALASAGRADPVEWTGQSGNVLIRLLVDGQKAAGTARGDTARATIELELAGTRVGSEYRGTARGVARRGAQSRPISGGFSAVVEGASPKLSLQLVDVGGENLTFSAPLSRQGAPQALKCISARGSVRRTPAKGVPTSLKSGDSFAVGDQIETGPAGAAILSLEDRSVVLMQENTRILVPDVPDNRSGVQRTQVSSGKVWFAVRSVPAGSRFEVSGQDVVASVRGTEFEIEADEEGEFNLTTAEGQVDVVDPTGTQPPASIREGEEWRLPARRLRAARWGARRAAQLETKHSRWMALLEETDRVWPFRRAGKPRFWQDRFRRPQPIPGGKGGGPMRGPNEGLRPGAFPGGGRRSGPPGQTPDRKPNPGAGRMNPPAPRGAPPRGGVRRPNSPQGRSGAGGVLRP